MGRYKNNQTNSKPEKKKKQTCKLTRVLLGMASFDGM